MATTRKQYTAKFKARVAIEAIRGEKTLNQLGSQFGLHPVQIAHWRRTALDHIEDLFVDGRTRRGQDAEAEADRSSLEHASFFFHEVQLHFQPANLFNQRVPACVAVMAGLASSMPPAEGTRKLLVD